MESKEIIIYPAVLTKTDTDGYYVEFPDLPGCVTQGDSINDSIIKAQEALAIYYYEKGGVICNASDIFKIQKSFPNSLIQMISLNPNTYILRNLSSVAVKKTLTIPDWLDKLSKKYDVNYSQLLKQALIKYLKEYDGISEYDKIILNS